MTFSLNIKSLRTNRMEISFSAFLIFVVYIKIEALRSPNSQQSKKCAALYFTVQFYDM